MLTYGGVAGARTAQIGGRVLAAFLLYLRRFFEPMQELSQFYNALQSATAALEKLSGVLEETPGGARARPTRVPLPAARPRARSTFEAVTFGYRTAASSCTGST